MLVRSQGFNLHLLSKPSTNCLHIQAEPGRWGAVKLTVGSDCKGTNHNLSVMIIHKSPSLPSICLSPLQCSCGRLPWSSDLGACWRGQNSINCGAIRGENEEGRGGKDMSGERRCKGSWGKGGGGRIWQRGSRIRISKTNREAKQYNMIFFFQCSVLEA